MSEGYGSRYDAKMERRADNEARKKLSDAYVAAFGSQPNAVAKAIIEMSLQKFDSGSLCEWVEENGFKKLKWL